MQIFKSMLFHIYEISNKNCRLVILINLVVKFRIAVNLKKKKEKKMRRMILANTRRRIRNLYSRGARSHL